MRWDELTSFKCSTKVDARKCPLVVSLDTLFSQDHPHTLRCCFVEGKWSLRYFHCGSMRWPTDRGGKGSEKLSNSPKITQRTSCSQLDTLY